MSTAVEEVESKVVTGTSDTSEMFTSDFKTGSRSKTTSYETTVFSLKVDVFETRSTVKSEKEEVSDNAIWMFTLVVVDN